MSEYHHIPVMMREVMEYLDVRPGKIYVDGTLGGCGHSKEILKRILPHGLLIGMDQDNAAISNARTRLGDFHENVRLFHKNYASLWDVLESIGIPSVDGILLDLGLSLFQIESSGRGFSFRKDEPLDMRMNEEGPITAADIVNDSSQEHLSKIFWEYGEERMSRRISKRIVKERAASPIKTSARLAAIVCAAMPSSKKSKIHPATRTFMALRIAVNRELEKLTSFMESLAESDGSRLSPGGRICVLSFHSLEDRIVKHAFRDMSKGCRCPAAFPKCVCNKKKILRILTPKVIRPGQDEIGQNPMSRSTKLRAAEKI